MSLRRAVCAALVAVSFGGSTPLWAENHATQQPAEVSVTKSHAYSVFVEPKYGPDFQHFDWVNPDAPKGGVFVNSRLGGFDNFNRYTDKGDSAAGLTGIAESLLVGSGDEKDVYYGLIAHTIEYPSDYAWVKFYMRPEAAFSDGTPITAQDVLFSFDALTNKTQEFYRTTFADIDRVDMLDAHTVIFYAKDGKASKEFPALAGIMDIMPQHYWDGRDLLATTLEPPLGSGPYIIKNFEPNRYVEWELNPNYWGKDLPVNKGLNNFAVMRDEYYKDSTVMRNAFKAGEFDTWVENRSKSWSTEYEPGKIKALDQGFMVRELVPDATPQPFQTMVFNYNRPQLRDWRVRRAVNRLLNFEWTNKTIFFDAYQRTTSIFANTEDMAAHGLPQGRTLEILTEFKDDINPLIFTEVWRLPETDGSKNNRASMKLALEDLQAAGYEIARSGADKGKLVHKDTGEQLQMEFLFYSDTFDAILAPLVADMQTLGIDASMKRIDTNAWISRIRDRNYDITSISYSNGFFPGFEQKGRWHSEFAEVPLSWNATGMKSPVVDTLIERLIGIEDYDELAATARALDYVLKWDYPGLFEWNLPATRFVYWDKFGKPDTRPAYGLGLAAWWYDAEKAQAIKDAGF